MDQPSQGARPSSGQPSEDNGTPYTAFINGVHDYADLHTASENTGFDPFNGWDANLFSGNNQSSSTLPPPPDVTSNYNQDSSGQSKSPSQLPFQQHHQPMLSMKFTQPFDPRQYSQPQWDPRYIQRPSQSPGPYAGFPLSGSMNYGRPDQVYTSTPPFHSQPPLQPRPQHNSASPYPTQPTTSQYFQNYGLQQMTMQPRDMMYTNDFTDFYNQHQASRTVNPSELSSNGPPARPSMANHAQAPQNPQQFTGSPYFSSSMAQYGGQAQQTAANGQTTFHAATHLQMGPTPATKPKVPKDPNALKRPKGRSRKDSTIPRAKKDGQSQSVSSESSSDDDDEPPEPKPALLVVTRPTDVIGSAMYDAVSAVWAPGNKRPIWDNITKGMVLFADAIKSLRDTWKVKNESLKKAELANSSTVHDLKDEVARFRKGMETTMQRSVQFGHDAHLCRLGENVHLLLALHSFLLDRFNAADYDGSLVSAILRLIAKFSTMTEESLEKTKLSKILQRLTKKGGADSKELAQKILSNAAEATKRAEGTKTDSTQVAIGTGTPKPQQSVTPAINGSDTAAGTKRPREAEHTNGQPTKRIITKPIPQASKPLAIQAAERRRAEAAAQAKAAKSEKLVANGNEPAAVPSLAPGATSAATQEKPKPTVAVPIKAPGNLFASLQSASKKPGTSNAARAAAAKDKPLLVSKNETSPQPAAATNKAVASSTFSFSDVLADMSKPKEVERKKVEETQEESEEDRAKRLRKEQRRKLRVSWKPDDSLVEIQLFTHDPEEESGHAESMRRDVDDVGGEGRMLKLHMDKKGLEDEDDEADGEGEEMEDYATPTEVDFDDIPAEERERNFVRAGGSLKPDSASSRTQETFEQNTLMVVYALPADVPPSPKEPPPASDEDDYQPVAEFGEPGEVTRSREVQRRVAGGQAQSAYGAPNININAILQSFNPTSTQTQPSLPINLQQTIGNAGHALPVAQGTNTIPALSNLSNIIAAVQRAQQTQFSAPPEQSNALAAALAQYTQPQHMPLATSMNDNPNPYGGANAEDGSRKHGRGDSNDYDAWNASKKKKPSNDTGGLAIDDPLWKYKTQRCSFYQEGKCLKGDKCTFVHDNDWHAS